MRGSIEQAAWRLRLAVLSSWALLVLGYVAGRLGVAAGPLRFETHADAQGAGTPIALDDICMVLLTVALVRLVQMLSEIAESHYFSVAAVRSFRGFAFWLFLLALLRVAAPIVSELLRDSARDAHEYEFQISVSNVLTVAITLLLFLVARLLERARQLEQDMREIV